MKAIFILSWSLLSTAVFADGISMVCDGKTQAPRDKVVTGKVNVIVSGTIAPHSDPVVFEEGYSYSVGFQDASIGDLSCGRPTANIQCSLKRNYYAEPFSVYEACDFNGTSGLDTRGLASERFSSRLTVSGDHGFFYCADHDSKVYVHMELSGCQ